MTRVRTEAAVAQEANHSKSPIRPSKQRMAISSSPRRTTSPSKEETKTTKATTKATSKATTKKSAAATKPVKAAAAKSPVPAKSRAVKKSPIKIVKSAGRRSVSSSAVNKISSKSESDATIYKEGSYVCFVNGADKKDDAKWDKFCIGKVSKKPRFTERPDKIFAGRLSLGKMSAKERLCLTDTDLSYRSVNYSPR